jgi:hypothetical protein
VIEKLEENARGAAWRRGSRSRASAFSVQIGSFWRSHGDPYSAPAFRTLRFAQAPTLTVLRGCIAMSGTAGWSGGPPGEGAHALVFFADVVMVELADSERSELGDAGCTRFRGLKLGDGR